jgi:hypothetical protein
MEGRLAFGPTENVSTSFEPGFHHILQWSDRDSGKGIIGKGMETTDCFCLIYHCYWVRLTATGFDWRG